MEPTRLPLPDEHRDGKMPWDHTPELEEVLAKWQPDYGRRAGIKSKESVGDVGREHPGISAESTDCAQRPSMALPVSDPKSRA